MMDQYNNLSTPQSRSQLTPKPANPCILIIFGITGDLTKRLLFPALCNLGSSGLLDENFCIVGVAQKPYTTETFRQQLIKNIDEFIFEPSAKEFALHLVKRVEYVSGDFADANTYTDLKNKLTELNQLKASKNYLFYFAVPPGFIEVIATQLNQAALVSEEKNSYFRRIVVEKPFGHDLTSAQKLDELLGGMVDENQIFRIDHFLGKEPIQNLLAFRFSNSLFEPMWNRLYVDHIEITVAEILGVELRGNYYEHAGALRDMVPNHLFQILSLITMEPPSSFSAENIRLEKTKVLNAVKRLTPEKVLSQAIRGQYGQGKINGAGVVGYRNEPNVAANSPVETYVALKLLIDNERWLNVPFYLRTGKRMPIQHSEIVLQFKAGVSSLFNSSEKILPNLLRMYIQPEQGISLCFNAKVPGQTVQLAPVSMKFKYSDFFDIKPQTGYETILYDCINGDHLLFSHADMVEITWALVQPILDIWNDTAPQNFPNYAAGTWGPNEANILLQQDGRQWLVR